ncbi:hypothetical protein HGG72_18965 [Ochrobactrum pecoris]|nr:hypothetical protein [Brucella pecoris]
MLGKWTIACLIACILVVGIGSDVDLERLVLVFDFQDKLSIGVLDDFGTFELAAEFSTSIGKPVWIKLVRCTLPLLCDCLIFQNFVVGFPAFFANSRWNRPR